MPCSSYDHSKVETENRYPEQTIQSEVARGYPGDDHLGVYFGRNPKRGVDECLRLLHTKGSNFMQRPSQLRESRSSEQWLTGRIQTLSCCLVRTRSMRAKCVI